MKWMKNAKFFIAIFLTILSGLATLYSFSIILYRVKLFIFDSHMRRYMNHVSSPEFNETSNILIFSVCTGILAALLFENKRAKISLISLSAISLSAVGIYFLLHKFGVIVSYNEYLKASGTYP